MGSLTSPVESGRSQEPIGLLISGALILREHESATCNRVCRQIHFTDFIRFLCLRIGWWEVLHEPPRELTVNTVVSCRFFQQNQSIGGFPSAPEVPRAAKTGCRGCLSESDPGTLKISLFFWGGWNSPNKKGWFLVYPNSRLVYKGKSENKMDDSVEDLGSEHWYHCLN